MPPARRDTLSRIGKFVVSGATAAAVHLGLFYALVEVSGVWYLPASAISFSAGFVVSFILQKFWTFESAALAAVPAELFRYAAAGAAGLLANSALLAVFVEVAGVSRFPAQVIAALLVAAGMFVLYGRAVFRRTP